MTIAQAFENPLRLLQTGNIEAAAIHFEHLLQEQPNHSDALHLLGICHFASEIPERGELRPFKKPTLRRVCGQFHSRRLDAQ